MNNLTKRREWETSGSPEDGLPEVGGESLRAKPAKSDQPRRRIQGQGCCIRRNGLGITDSEGVGSTESCSIVTPAG